MMSPDSMAAKPASKEESQSSSAGRKTSSSKPQEAALKCPRCDSPNTKFCYYNNYSLSQPRHFCKTCRRYWTKGGALRNVPIGGGCRKNKKMKSSSRLCGDSKESSGGASSDIGGLKFFHGFSPAMDFQLGGISYPRLQNSNTVGVFNNLSSFRDISTTSSGGLFSSNPCFNLEPSASSASLLTGFNFPLPSSMFKQGGESTAGGLIGGVQQDMGSLNIHSNIASSIESLSSINQDLHWKLQQQRLAMLFGGENQKESSVSSMPIDIQKPQPILFHNLENSKAEACGISNSRKESANLATEWFFDNSYAPVDPTPTNTSGSGDGAANNWNGFQAWGNLNQFSALP